MWVDFVNVLKERERFRIGKKGSRKRVVV